MGGRRPQVGGRRPQVRKKKGIVGRQGEGVGKDGGGEEGKFTGFTAGLTRSGLGLFVNVVDFVVAGFGGSLLLGGTVAVFLMVSGFSAGFLG